MSLHLVSMLVHAAEEVTSTMNVEHDPIAVLGRFPSLIVVTAHLNPFTFEVGPSALTPLPPLRSTDPCDALRSQLLDNGLGGSIDAFARDDDVVYLDPSWMRHPAGCE